MCDTTKDREAMSDTSASPTKGRPKLIEMTAQDFYFDTCAHWSTHLSLIRSSKRWQMLIEFFTQKDKQGNKLFAGKSILDLSVGCGLVAMLAVKVGEAKQIVAVDRSNILDAARQIMRENSLHGTVYTDEEVVRSSKSKAQSANGNDSEATNGDAQRETVRRRVRRQIDCIKLKTDFENDAQILRMSMKKLQFDVIMCSRLLFSSTSETDAFDTALLRSLIVARDRFLKRDGVILPAELIFHVVGIENVSYKEEKIDWWKCVHGFNMSALQPAILKDVVLRSVDGLQAVTRPQTLHTINFYTAQRQQVECFQSAFDLKMLRFAYVNALAVYTEVVLRFTERPPDQNEATSTTQDNTAVAQPDSSFLSLNDALSGNDDASLVVAQGCDQKNCNSTDGEPIQSLVVSANVVSTTLSKGDDSSINGHGLVVEQSRHEPSQTSLSPISSDGHEEVANKKVAVAEVCSYDNLLTRPHAAASSQQRSSEISQSADIANLLVERHQLNSTCNNPASCSKRRPKRLRQQKGIKANGCEQLPMQTSMPVKDASNETTKVHIPVYEARWSGEPGNMFGLRQNVFFLHNSNCPLSRPFIVARLNESIKGHFAMKTSEPDANWSSSNVPIDVACQTDFNFDVPQLNTNNRGHSSEPINACSNNTLSLEFRVEATFGKSEHVPYHVASTQTDVDGHGVSLIADECECAAGRVCPTRYQFESLREYEMPLSFVFERTSANSVKSEQLPDYYFDSYASFGVHEVMLRDVARTTAYRYAVCRNAHLFENKVVLDVGCGTGILSMFAAQTGSKHVIGVDKSNIIEYARRIVKDNRLDSKMTLLKCHMEDAQLPPARLNANGKVDILISEWMGYCLFYEAMLTTVIVARERWLDTNGRILPDRATLQICGVKDAINRQHYVEAWKGVHGFSMKFMSDLVRNSVLVHAISEDQLVTNSCLLRELDLRTIKADEIPFTALFVLQALRRDTLDALCVWFTVDFSRLDWSVVLDTAPHVAATHWQHTVFYVEDESGDPLHVDEGEVIRGTFTMIPNSRNKRDLDFVIVIFYRGKTIQKSFRL